MNFQSVIDLVPDYKVFLTVDEMDKSSRKLAEEFPAIVTVFEAGKSRNGTLGVRHQNFVKKA